MPFENKRTIWNNGCWQIIKRRAKGLIANYKSNTSYSIYVIATPASLLQ